jgi:hypothetical protein
MITRSVEYGVRLPDGTIQDLHYDADTAAVMSYQEYARQRAAAVRGVVVSRTSEVMKSDWVPEPTRLEQLRTHLLAEVARVRELQRDAQYGGAQELADLVEEYLEATESQS